jgi:hypothetical protein
LQRGQHRQVRIDGIGFAFATAGLAVRLLALDHQQASGRYRAGQPGTVAAGALD